MLFPLEKNRRTYLRIVFRDVWNVFAVSLMPIPAAKGSIRFGPKGTIFLVQQGQYHLAFPTDFEFRSRKQAGVLERVWLLDEQAERLKEESDKLGGC